MKSSLFYPIRFKHNGLSFTNTEHSQSDKVISYMNAQSRICISVLCLHMVRTDYVKWSCKILSHKVLQLRIQFHKRQRTDRQRQTYIRTLELIITQFHAELLRYLHDL